MNDPRVEKFADLLVDYSTRIQPGDRVIIEAGTAALPLVRALYARILERGGVPAPLIRFPGEEALLLKHADDEVLARPPIFQQLAYETFEARIRIHSETNTRQLTNVPAERQKLRQQAMAPIIDAQMRRGATGEFKWVTTLFPTEAYAMEAENSLDDFADFVFRACHLQEDDPVAYWRQVQAEQQRYVDYLQGKDRVVLRGPNVDLSLSIRGRTFLNSCGIHNMPDGEIYTGPVEESVNGWVRFSYPTVYQGVLLEGVELTFSDGRVVQARADKNQDFLLRMLEVDPGARYLGEFAVGLNYEIDRFSRHILFDEKLGGSFHMALGAGYPETGSQNKSMIHWDMICGMEDSEIEVDGEVIYRDGRFLI